ncbi:DAZ-associated protein 2 [Lonchura striata]|uniref:DAZ-associated protein 2 n=1 Tax=Lonchura striata TaxID=40157 RepID=A0A218U813_9PASE|nr:DAZ-associated protein 2 [Lonchura striata domestica]
MPQVRSPRVLDAHLAGGWHLPDPADPVLFQLYRLSFVPLGAAGVPPVSPAYPGVSLYLPLAPPPPVGALGSPVAYFPLGQLYPPGSTLLLDGGFDTAARLGTGGTASIPCPRLSPVLTLTPAVSYRDSVPGCPLS